MASLEIPQGYLNFDFACCSPENIDTLYMKVLGITSFPKRTITKKINLCRYDENDVADQDKWEADDDGEVFPLLNNIAEEKEFDNERDNNVSMGG